MSPRGTTKEAPPTMMSRLKPCAAGLLLALLAGCATPRMQVPEKLDLPPPRAIGGEQVLQSGASDTMRESPTPPRPDSQNPSAAGVSARDALPAGLGGPPVSVNVSNLPIPTFVNSVLGDMLKLTFKLDPAVQQLTELVTLRTSRPQPPAELYRIARQVLGDYGVDMVSDGNVVRLTMAPAGTRLDPPIVYSGRALPDVPVTHRPVFYLMELQAIRSSEAMRWLKAIYGEDVKAEFNKEPHVRDTASMARAASPDSADSQFFICFDDARFLDKQYTVWGQVESGMEHVDALPKGEPPRAPGKIVKATVG